MFIEVLVLWQELIKELGHRGKENNPTATMELILDVVQMGENKKISSGDKNTVIEV